jgi:hypothetical protein
MPEPSFARCVTRSFYLVGQAFCDLSSHPRHETVPLAERTEAIDFLPFPLKIHCSVSKSDQRCEATTTIARPNDQGRRDKQDYGSSLGAERKSRTVAAVQFSRRRILAMIGSGRSKSTSTLAWVRLGTFFKRGRMDYLATRAIVDVHVSYGNRRALEDLRAHRGRLIDGLKASGRQRPYDIRKPMAQIEDEIAVINAGLAKLKPAA